MTKTLDRDKTGYRKQWRKKQNTQSYFFEKIHKIDIILAILGKNREDSKS